MIHGAMGAGQGRCAVANRMESAPTHCVRLSSCPERLSVVDEGVSVGMASRLIIGRPGCPRIPYRSEEHTSELQSLRHLVCRLLLEKKTTTMYRNSPPLSGLMLPQSFDLKPQR